MWEARDLRKISPIGRMTARAFSLSANILFHELISSIDDAEHARVHSQDVFKIHRRRDSVYKESVSKLDAPSGASILLRSTRMERNCLDSALTCGMVLAVPEATELCRM
jgi:hypothetical protein